MVPSPTLLRFTSVKTDRHRDSRLKWLELLRPADDRNTWLVYTRWKDEESFQAWVSGSAFQQGHKQAEGASQPVATGSELWQFTVEQHTTNQEAKA